MPPKPNKLEQQNDRLEELVYKLEERLAVLSEPELKKACLKYLVSIKRNMDGLREGFEALYEVLGCSYNDVSYPENKEKYF